jgi:hypothetical protein
MAFHAGTNIDQRPAVRIGPPQRQLALGVGGHENADGLIVRPNHRRHPRQLSRDWLIETRPDVNGQHQLDIELGRRLEWNDASKPAVPIAPSTQNHRRVVHGECAAGAQHVDERGDLGPGSEQHQFPCVQVDCRNSERSSEVSEAACGNHILDEATERSRLEQGTEEETGYRSEPVSNDTAAPHPGDFLEELVVAHSTGKSSRDYCSHRYSNEPGRLKPGLAHRTVGAEVRCRLCAAATQHHGDRASRHWRRFVWR